MYIDKKIIAESYLADEIIMNTYTELISGLTVDPEDEHEQILSDDEAVDWFFDRISESVIELLIEEKITISQSVYLTMAIAKEIKGWIRF